MKKQSSLGLMGVLVASFIGSLTTSALASVHAGDQLDIAVYNHPELSRKVTVGSNGAVSLPLAGSVPVGGLEPKYIALRIENALNRYVVAPAVSVELIAQTASIFLSGPNGGVLKYQPGETLVSAIADIPAGSGGTAGPSTSSPVGDLERSRIDMRHVAVQRDGVSLGIFDVVALAAKGESGPGLEPGDTLALQNKPIAVRVLGDVKRPGFAYLSSDEPLSNAIDQVGGIDVSAATGHIGLQRASTTSSLALGDPEFLAPARVGDVVTVPTAPRVSVVGLVTKPGPVVLKTDFSLLDALYEAGGPTQWADLGHVRVMHDGKSAGYNVAALQRGDMSQNPDLHDGDTVYVSEGHKVDFRSIFQSLLPFSFFLPRLGR